MKAETPPDRAWTPQDVENLNTLRTLRFTLPVTLDDCVEAFKYAHTMKWSSRPCVDFMCNDGKRVEMSVRIGTDTRGMVFDAE